MSTQFVRSENDKMIAGVCAGIARYMHIDPVFVRLAFVLAVFLGGVSPLLYVLLWIVMPLDRAATPPRVHLIADHPRPVEEWKFDPHTGEPIRRS